MTRGRWWMPWRVLRWLDALDLWCWADLVLWKLDRTAMPPRRAMTCAIAAAKDGCVTCYCGHWDNLGRALDSARPSPESE